MAELCFKCYFEGNSVVDSDRWPLSNCTSCSDYYRSKNEILGLGTSSLKCLSSSRDLLRPRTRTLSAHDHRVQAQNDALTVLERFSPRARAHSAWHGRAYGESHTLIVEGH